MKLLKLILLFAVISTYYSCENFDWFRSEGTMGKQIQGTWKREFFKKDTTVQESWTFKDGKLTILRYDLFPYNSSYCSALANADSLTKIQNGYKCYDNGIVDSNKFDGNDTLIFDTGNYSVDAKLTVSYLKSSNFTQNDENSHPSNYKWTIILIDNKILEIAADDPDGAGILQREFEKK